MTTLSNQELAEIITVQLPRLLTEQPELKMPLYKVFLDALVQSGEFTRLWQELADYRAETQAKFKQVDQRFDAVDQRFDAVDQRFDAVDQRFDDINQRIDTLEAKMTTDFEAVYLRLSEQDAMIASRFAEQDAEFKALNQKLDRIGARWGIFVESTFRETVKSLLEESFGAIVQQLWIKGEQFDIVIMHNEHILIEMTAQPKRNAQRKLERKRDLYIDHTGITPARIILAVGSINSRHAEALRQAGFEVIEPNLYEDEDE